MSSGMAKRLMGDVKEIVSQTFRDSPAVFIEEYNPPQGVNLKGPTYTALVIGPPETPYAHGFFLFRISVDCCYPNTCPSVLFLSTDGGNVRLNPNLYANGKVCLSILGTWAGDKWRCSYSLLYLLRCLQSMVLVQDPFFNEPGTDRACRESQLMSGHYTNRIFHESMRVTVLNVVEALLKITPPDVPSMIRAEEKSNPLTGAAAGTTPPTPVSAADGSMSPNVPDTPGLSEVGNDEAFPSMTPDGTPVMSSVPTLLLPEQVGLPRGAAMNNFVRTLHAPFAPWIKRYCYVWLESYEAALSRPEALALDHTVMKVPPFCKLSATQESTFQHENLLERIRNVGAALDEETASWRREGEEVGKAGLENHYYGRVMVEALRVFDVDGVMASLEDDSNPFVWNFLILNPNSPAPTSAADDVAEQSSCCSHHPATNIYEQSMYRVEAVFCPSSSSEPPRLRFMQPIWHPNISPKRGVPFCFSCEAAIAGDDRFLPRTVAKQLWELLAMAPLSSLTAAVNPEAHRLCFSQNENDRVLFLRRARNLAAATLE